MREMLYHQQKQGGVLQSGMPEEKKKELQNVARRKYISQKVPTKRTKTLAELSVEARAAGMTYGQYVAKMGL